MAKNYIIVAKTDHLELEDAVSNYLNDGWSLVGGLIVAQTDIESESPNQLKTTYIQAIIKED